MSTSSPPKGRLIFGSLIVIIGMGIMLYFNVFHKEASRSAPGHGGAPGVTAPPAAAKDRDKDQGEAGAVSTARPGEPASASASAQSPSSKLEPGAPSGSPALTAAPAGIEQEQEVASGDPLLKKFVNAKGELTREIRHNAAGLPLLETRYADGQKSTIEKTYADDGTLLRTRRYVNDRLVESQDLR